MHSPRHGFWWYGTQRGLEVMVIEKVVESNHTLSENKSDATEHIFLEFFEREFMNVIGVNFVHFLNYIFS